MKYLRDILTEAKKIYSASKSMKLEDAWIHHQFTPNYHKEEIKKLPGSDHNSIEDGYDSRSRVHSNATHYWIRINGHGEKFKKHAIKAGYKIQKVF